MIERFIGFCLFIVLAILSSCANQVAPTGGLKDTISPKAIKYIPENYSTNFPKTDIRISFSEYIKLKDVSTQLIVSPPLKYSSDVKIRSKTLLIHLDDTLLENTTYTFNFGGAITDNTEGNAAENFQYVFSTGNIIDSLKVSGKVENAFDNKVSKGIDVMLYKSIEDSVPYKVLPNYLAKTDSAGGFHISNVAAGTYKIIALKDTNSNYLFDNPDEAIAFSDSMVQAPDSGIVLRMFREKPKLRMVHAMADEPGKVVIAYNQPVPNPSFEFLTDTSKLQLFAKTFSSKGDSVTFWYRNQLSDSLSMIIHRKPVNDTIALRLRRTDDKGKFKYVPKLAPSLSTEGQTIVDLTKPFELIFNHPVEKYDFSKITVTEDSVPVKEISFSFKDTLQQKLVLNRKWKEKARYVLFIPPGSFTDIFGIKNDTLQYIFTSKQVTDYGTLAIGLQLPLKRGHYLLQLIDDRETIYRQSAVTGDTILHYDYLDPKAYRIKLVEDRNNNGEWDTGNYLQHVQPEHVYYYNESITVRANWDVEVKWKAEIKD